MAYVQKSDPIRLAEDFSFAACIGKTYMDKVYTFSVTSIVSLSSFSNVSGKQF